MDRRNCDDNSVRLTTRAKNYVPGIVSARIKPTTQASCTHLAATSAVGEAKAAVDVGHLLGMHADTVLVPAHLLTATNERLDARRRRL